MHLFSIYCPLRLIELTVENKKHEDEITSFKSEVSKSPNVIYLLVMYCNVQVGGFEETS